MVINTEIAKIANLIGDKTRAAILLALIEGKALTAGEIALRAHISAQAASNQLKKLLVARLIEHIPTPTRYRYYKISSPLVAEALESLSLLTPISTKRPSHHERLDKDICFARTCYDHLAGKLGVQITTKLQRKNYLQLTGKEFILTNQGSLFFQTLKIDTNELAKQRRQFAKPCLDWTEREYHLAGSLGKALLDYFMNNRIVISVRKPRVMLLTTKGKLWLKENFE